MQNLNIFYTNSYEMPKKEQPSFYRFPIQNDRTNWLPVSTPTILVVPWAKDSFGASIPNSEVWDVSFHVEGSTIAPIAGHDHIGMFNPNYNLYRVDIPVETMHEYLIDTREVKFMRHDMSGVKTITINEAKDGDYFEYTLRNGTVGHVIYYTGADYYDFSNVSIPVEDLPRGKYRFVWQARYNKRIFNADGMFKCIYVCVDNDLRGCGLCRIEYLINHPGDILADMYDKTPAIYFDNIKKESDRTISLYRPIADALQDVFDEQTLLHGINWVNKIPPHYMPYLSYLIGIDLPMFPNATKDYNERIRRTMLERGANLQRMKGSYIAIVELLQIFGFVVDIAQCWITPDGKRFVAPNERLPEEYVKDPAIGTQEIKARDIAHADPFVVNFKENGFGEMTAPLVYPSIDGVIIYDSFVVEDHARWEPRTIYDLGDVVLPTTANGKAYKCVKAGVSGDSEPQWKVVDGEITSEADVQWQCVVTMKSALDKLHYDLIQNPDLLEDDSCSVRLDDNHHYVVCNLFERLTVDSSCSRNINKMYDGLVGYSHIVVNDILVLYEEHFGHSPYKPEIEVGGWRKNYPYQAGQYVHPIVDNGNVYQCIKSGKSGTSEPEWTDNINRIVSDGEIGWMCVSTGFKGIQRTTPGNIKFDRMMSKLSLMFAKYYEFGAGNEPYPRPKTSKNLTLYSFVTYKRRKIILPRIYQLSDLRTNRFDITIYSKFFVDADMSVYEYVVDFISRTKAFHSLLRKIIVDAEHENVYNVIDFCSKGSIAGGINTNHECLQVPPPTVPECDSQYADYYCKESDLEELVQKPADMSLRRRIMSGLKAEYEAWRNIKDKYDVNEDTINNIHKDSVIAPTLPDFDGFNYNGQDRKTAYYIVDNITESGKRLSHIQPGTIASVITVNNKGGGIDLVGNIGSIKQRFRIKSLDNAKLPPLPDNVMLTIEFRSELHLNMYYVAIVNLNPDALPRAASEYCWSYKAYDPRAKVTDITSSFMQGFCYTGRVKDLATPSATAIPGDVERFKPCDMLGVGAYFIDKDGTINYDGRLFWEGDYSEATHRLSLDIDRHHLMFPGHRFIRMDALETDFVHDVWKARPWDYDDNYAQCDEHGPCVYGLNYLNARLIDDNVRDCCGEASQILEFDDRPLIYKGNGGKADIATLSTTDTNMFITHSIFTNVGGGPYIEDERGAAHPVVKEETVDYTCNKYIEMSVPMFGSAKKHDMESYRDFVDGYPARFGKFELNAEDFWSYKDDAMCAGEDGNKLINCPHLCGCSDDRYIPESIDANLNIVPDIDNKTYSFIATLGSGIMSDLPEYSAKRLECGCLSVDAVDGKIDPDKCGIPIVVEMRGKKVIDTLSLIHI